MACDSAMAGLNVVWIRLGGVNYPRTPSEAAELTRQIAVALEQLGEVPDSLPPITPPAPLSDAEMAEGDLTEQRR